MGECREFSRGYKCGINDSKAWIIARLEDFGNDSGSNKIALEFASVPHEFGYGMKCWSYSNAGFIGSKDMDYTWHDFHSKDLGGFEISNGNVILYFPIGTRTFAQIAAVHGIKQPPREFHPIVNVKSFR